MFIELQGKILPGIERLFKGTLGTVLVARFHDGFVTLNGEFGYRLE